MKPVARDYFLALAFIAMCAVFALISPQFLSARNLSLMVIELSISATLAMGMLLVILPGQIDLSAGSGVGLIGGIASVLVAKHSFGAPAALLLALVCGVTLWFAMGSLIVRQRIPAFIVTLGGLLIFRGLFWLTIHNATTSVMPGGVANAYSSLTTFFLTPSEGYALAGLITGCLAVSAIRSRRQMARYGFAADDAEVGFLKLMLAGQLVFLFVIVANQFRGVPLPVLIFASIALSVHVLTQHTPFGRYLYAIGGNEEAAVISGVPVKSVVVTAFVILGAVVAITGFMQTAYAGASTTTTGDLMELDAIAACVIGGASLRGGRGKVVGVLFGALMMTCLLNGMTLLAVSPEYKYIARGAVLTLAVWMDSRFSRD